MSAMENRDEVLQLLERFTRLKQKEIPRELEDYLNFVARTGDTVYPWPAVKYFFRTKLSHVIMDFHDNTPSITDLPQCPNVDPFCYDRMKRTLLSRMESFNSAPFTIQRICELLNEPRKHYTRIDKFMRAVEKNILVVSTQEPGRRRSDSENGDSLDSIVNGDLEVNVDIEMDNEAFGIDSNEMVPNAATAAVIPSVSITTPAHAEEVPPSMESSEEQEQETEKHESETVPEVAPTDNGVAASEVNDAKPDEALPKQVNESDKDASGTAEEPAVPTDKLVYFAAAAPNSPEPSSLDSTEEPLPDVVDSVATDVLDQKEQNEAPPKEQRNPETQPTPESHDTSEPPTAKKPPNAIAPEADSDLIDEGEPKAKMAKLSQEESESQTIELKQTTVPVEELPADTEKDTVSSESTTDSNGSSIECLDCNISSDERAESSATLPSSSAETVESSVGTVGSNISSDENNSIIPSSSTETIESCSLILPPVVNEVPSPEQEKQAETEQPAEQTTDEPQTTKETSEAPSESTAKESKASIEKESIVKRIELEVNPSVVASEQPTAPPVNSDEMETVSSAVVSENVMATDEEEQPQSGAVDAVVPMAADASETAKSDENAMDIDESSVEPMDQ